MQHLYDYVVFYYMLFLLLFSFYIVVAVVCLFVLLFLLLWMVCVCVHASCTWPTIDKPIDLTPSSQHTHSGYRVDTINVSVFLLFTCLLSSLQLSCVYQPPCCISHQPSHPPLHFHKIPPPPTTPPYTQDVDLIDLCRIACGLLDIPLSEDRPVEALHLLFSAYLEIKASPWLGQNGGLQQEENGGQGNGGHALEKSSQRVGGASGSTLLTVS